MHWNRPDSLWRIKRRYAISIRRRVLQPGKRPGIFWAKRENRKYSPGSRRIPKPDWPNSDDLRLLGDFVTNEKISLEKQYDNSLKQARNKLNNDLSFINTQRFQMEIRPGRQENGRCEYIQAKYFELSNG